MKIIKTTQLTKHQLAQINQLWNDEYPIKLKDRFPILLDGIDRYNHYFIEDKQQDIIAWAVDFEKEKQVRFSIIVSSNIEFYGWVIDHNDDLKNNGDQYLSPISFYLKHGFEILNDIRIDSEMIKAVLIKWVSIK
ncbi:MAG: hypothetical protein NTU43_02955 [Bacteroidetes bacterium]|nr:hypothetical protein [Bacteroidota bacterium]